MFPWKACPVAPGKDETCSGWWNEKSGPQFLDDSSGGRKPKPSLLGVHVGPSAQLALAAFHDLPGLGKLKLASGWKTLAEATRGKSHKGSKGKGVSGGNSFCERLVIPSSSNCEERGRLGVLERNRGRAFLHEQVWERRGR